MAQQRQQYNANITASLPGIMSLGANQREWSIPGCLEWRRCWRS